MKKLFMIVALFFISIGLTACGESEAERIVEEARASLQIYDTDISQIRGSFNVPLQARGGVEVSWEVSDENLLELGDVYEPSEEGDLREQRILVTRPAEDEDHADITLIATLTYEDATSTREFDGRVMAEVPTTVYDAFEDIFEEATLGDNIVVRGIVIGRVGQGYFLWDGEHAFSVYGGGNHNLGDEVEVTGEYAKYYTLHQIGGPDNEEVISTGNDYALEDIGVVDSSISEMLALDFEDPRTHGLPYRIEGIVVEGDLVGSGFTNWYIQSVDDTSEFVMITHFNHTNSIGKISEYEGEYISITVSIYTDHATNKLLTYFDYDNVDIDILELDEQQQLDSDIGALEDQSFMTTDAVDLPSEGPRGSVISNWSSSNASVIDNAGSVQSAPTDYAEVDFTADIAYGDATGEVTITVTVVGNQIVNVDNVLSKADGEKAHVEGVVTAFDIFNTGLFMQDEAGNAIYVRIFDTEADMFADVEVGNKITVFGEVDRYASWGNNQKQISSNKLLTSNDGGNHELVIETEMSLMDILSGFVPFDEEEHGATQPGGMTNSKIYTLENVVIGDIDEYGAYFLEGALDDDTHELDGMHMIFDEDNLELLNIDPSDIEIGTEIASITFVTERIHFDNYRIVVIDIELE